MQELHATQEEVCVDRGGIERQEEEGSECGCGARDEGEEDKDGGGVGDDRRAIPGIAWVDGWAGG